MTIAPTPEILDIGQAIDRWDEIIDRTESGETFIIAVDGIPKARLEPMPPSDAQERNDTGAAS